MLNIKSLDHWAIMVDKVWQSFTSLWEVCGIVDICYGSYLTMAGGTVNLSLLARGIGEVKKNGHEKIDVVLEPEVW